MLALVKMPHTEISIHGEAAEAILDYLRKKFPVEIIVPAANSGTADDENETVNIFETDWWKENEYLLLTGARLKHDMTQEALAEKSGIKQSVISQYESGKRKITLRAAIKLGKALGEKPEMLLPRKCRERIRRNGD